MNFSERICDFTYEFFSLAAFWVALDVWQICIAFCSFRYDISRFIKRMFPIRVSRGTKLGSHGVMIINHKELLMNKLLIFWTTFCLIFPMFIRHYYCMHLIRCSLWLLWSLVSVLGLLEWVIVAGCILPIRAPAPVCSFSIIQSRWIMNFRGWFYMVQNISDPLLHMRHLSLEISTVPMGAQ